MVSRLQLNQYERVIDAGGYGVLWKSGSLAFEGRSLSGLTAWRYAFAWGLVFLLVGIFDESLLRGYLLI